MWETIVAWRGEITTTAAVLLMCLLFKLWLRQPWWRLFFGGLMLGVATEFITEPEWQYSLKVYIWRDVSPFIMVGWGVLFVWWITISDALYRVWFRAEPGGAGGFWRLRLLDAMVGLPLCLANEIFGMQVLKIWTYSPILHWNLMIPILNYPLEGLLSAFLFSLYAPQAVRYWKAAPWK